MANLMKLTRAVIFVLACILFAQGEIAAQAMTNERKSIKPLRPTSCNLDRARLFGYVFPNSLPGKGIGYSLVIRYVPAYGPEKQLLIFHPERGGSQVMIYSAQGKSVRDQLDQLLSKRNCGSFLDVAARVKIDRTVIDLSEEEVDAIRDGFFDVYRSTLEFERSSNDRTKTDVVVLSDGAEYTIEYSGASDFHLTSEGGLIDGEKVPDEPPFIEWARKIFRQTGKPSRSDIR